MCPSTTAFFKAFLNATKAGNARLSLFVELDEERTEEEEEEEEEEEALRESDAKKGEGEEDDDEGKEDEGKSDPVMIDKLAEGLASKSLAVLDTESAPLEEEDWDFVVGVCLVLGK